MIDNVLSVLIFFPLIAALFIFIFLRSDKISMWMAFFASLVEMVIVMPLMLNFDKSVAGMQFVEKYQWIKSFGIDYYVGVDGISILMIFLAALLSSISILASFTYIKKSKREFYLSLLILESAMIGVFVSLDFFLFYIFWEAMLFPVRNLSISFLYH